MYRLLPLKAFFLGLATVASHFWLLVGYLGQYFIRSSPYTFLLPKKSRKFSPPPPPPLGQYSPISGWLREQHGPIHSRYAGLKARNEKIQ